MFTISKLHITVALIKLNMPLVSGCGMQHAPLLYVYSLMVQSAPVEKIHGCMGCQFTSRTPNSSRFSCVCSFLSGTIKGFCSKSLKEKQLE